MDDVQHSWEHTRTTDLPHTVSVRIKSGRRSAEVDKKCTAATIFRRGFLEHWRCTAPKTSAVNNIITYAESDGETLYNV